jgi:hypothetical protein
LALLSVVAGILLASVLSATGARDSGFTKSSAPLTAATDSRSVRPLHSTARTSRPRPKPPAVADSLGAHREFAGRAFSIAYPREWTVKAAEAPTSWGTDTTIIAPDDPHTMVRIDVVSSPISSDPLTVAQPVIAGVAAQRGYRALGLITGTFERRPAAQWEFLVSEKGVMLHKQDVFFTPHAGTVIALLTSAPADRYQSLVTRFIAIRHSFVTR